jgi:hypothetical protein
MKNNIRSLITVLAAFSFSPLANAYGPFSATTDETADELCVESAAVSIVEYLQNEEPGAKIAIVRDSQGALTGLTDENGIYSDLEFSNVFEDDVNTHIYEFRDGDFIVFATVTMFAPNGMISCKVTDVDSGQDDQD